MSTALNRARYLADQLGHVRDEIRALKAREQALRAALVDLRPNGAVEGAAYTVELRQKVRRSFDAKRLPDDIRADPRFWKETPATTVLVRPRADLSDDFELIETL